MSAPTILLGLDGASWDLVNRLDVDLPTLESCRTVSAVSESNLPPVTCPNWRCLSSGKTPGQLGVYWWEKIDIDAGEIHLSEASDFRTADLWDYLAEQGVNCGVVNMPLTYPPEDVSVPFIAGGPDCSSDSYTSPDRLASELEAELDYRVHTRTTVSSPKTEITEDVLELIDLRFEASRYLYREYDLDFLFTVLYYLVRLEHYYWDDEPVERAWKRIDEHLSWFVDEGFNICLASDHGCAEIDTLFNINEWLAAHGYVEVVGGNTDAKGSLASRGVNAEDIASFLSQFGIQGLVSQLVPAAVKNRLPDSEVGYSGRNKAKIVDWEETTAIASGQGPVYLTPDADADQLAEELLAATGPNDRPVLESVHQTSELYPESATDATAPDLIVEGRKGVHVTDDIGSGMVVQTASSRDKWRAENFKDGLFAASGPNITSEWDRDRVALCDIAPTILHLLDCPIPTDISAEALPIRSHDREIRTRDPIDFCKSDRGDGDSAVENRLEDLGYL